MLQWLDEVVEQQKPRASNDSLAVIDETRSWRGFIKPENSTVKDDWHENVWNVEVRSSSLWWVREGITGKSPTGQVCNIDGVSPNTAVAQLITNRAERGKIGNAYAEASALVKRRPDSAHAHFALGLWCFRVHATQERVERRAARIAGAFLFALAAYVLVISVMTLLGYSEPKPTYLGIAILTAAAAIMPLLAKEKRKLSADTGSAALRGDAAESALCAYLSLIALAGLALNTIWHVAWADPVAALALTPLIVREAREAIRGKACGCC